MNKRQFIIAAFLFLVIFGFSFYKACSFLNEFSNGFAGDGKSDFNIIRTAESPDGKYSATFWSRMGGGAAGWCRQYINVYGKEKTFDLNKSEENQKTQVFDVRCDSDVEMNWKSANHLHIAFSVDKNGTNAAMNSENKDGAVKISYQVK